MQKDKPEHETDISNRLTPTIKNRVGGAEKPVFSLLKMSVADSKGNPRVSRKVKTNARGLPYRPPRLIDHGGNMAKPWYIIFYAFDIGINKLVRKRLGKNELNSINNLTERRETARSLMADLNQQLALGGYLETEPERPVISAFDFHGYKLINAILYVERYKKEKAMRVATNHFRYLRTTLERFMDAEQIPRSFLLRQVTKNFVVRFSHYMTNAGLAAKTHNHLIAVFHNSIDVLRRLDPTLFRDGNPTVGIDRHRVVSKKHAAYNTEQLEKLRALIEPADAQLLLFIRFLYYTLARPKELRFLKVGHIQMSEKRILMLGENAKTSREDFVGINANFAAIIRTSGILDYPPDYFVFTHLQTPGTEATGINYFAKRFRVFLNRSQLKKVNHKFTLYSFKHTGAVQLFLGTKDPEMVRKQCRHTNLSQTITYLRDLGQFSSFEELEKQPRF